MTQSSSPALGLSIGHTTLAVVTADRAVTGRPVISRGGWLIDDFVDRVGDPVGIVAPDGSVHTGAALLAAALHELARKATAGRPLPAVATVAYPAIWRQAAVDALGRALRRIPVWSSGVLLVPDYAAALTALQENPGLPGRGVIAMCDFGASATTVTLVDAGSGAAIIGEPLRYPDFSGDLIDRALLTHVLTATGATPGATGTSAIKALTRLRAQCREAKERLSTQTVAGVSGAPAGVRGDIRITRPELDGIVRGPLAGLVAALQDMLQRNGIAVADLAAVASVGGMAAVPAVTTTLSEALRVPVITAGRPALAAAAGAALHVARGTTQTGVTVINPARGPAEPAAAAVAWSQAPDVPEVVPQLATRRPDPRPRVDFAAEPAPAGSGRTPWHRKPLVVAAAVLAVIAGAGGATALALHADTTASPVLPAPGVSPDRATAPASPTDDAPVPRTVVAVPAETAERPQTPPVTETAVVAPASEAPVSQTVPETAPTSEAPPPAAESAAESAPVTEVATPTPAPTQAPLISAVPPVPSVPPIPTIPPIPVPSIPIPSIPVPSIPIPSIPIPSIQGLPPLFPLPSG